MCESDVSLQPFFLFKYIGEDFILFRDNTAFGNISGLKIPPADYAKVGSDTFVCVCVCVRERNL